ncbi:MAG: IS21 family transposase [Bacillota bacterium]|nr:IS21 family transposase [Bacillota bacterium]
MKELTCNDSAMEILAQVINEMKSEQGNDFSLESVNLAELERRTGISRQRLRTLKKHNFQELPHGNTGKCRPISILDGYTSVIDNLLRQGVSNSSVCYDRLSEYGYTGSLSTVKRYISDHRHLIPAKRQLVAPQGSRGHRYETHPGEAFQMDWGFVRVVDVFGDEYTAACFAMICHHCGQRYVEFFPNARQENLFIGMLHAFEYMGVPDYVLTDNMKSVVIRRDIEGHPIWQKDYETFMKAVGFRTRLCKPRHPFTKGKVERLVQFVKDNFLAGRQFFNYTDLNREALKWCISQNSRYHQCLDGVPDRIHGSDCEKRIQKLPEDMSLMYFLCPERRISFDGFINYEGRRFGVPYSYTQRTVRVLRKDETIYIYSSDLSQLLTTHDVTWSRKDRYCIDQFPPLQPEEFPTAAVTTRIMEIEYDAPALGFDKFNFGQEDR